MSHVLGWPIGPDLLSTQRDMFHDEAKEEGCPWGLEFSEGGLKFVYYWFDGRSRGIRIHSGPTRYGAGGLEDFTRYCVGMVAHL